MNDEHKRHDVASPSGRGLVAALIDVDTLKIAGSVFGVLGAAGGSLAAIAFSAGYLAVKRHDAMVGLPTTIVDYSTYVRMGALFVSDSLSLLTKASIPTLLASVALLGVLTGILRLAVRGLRSSSPSPVLSSPWLRAFVTLVLLTLALLVIKVQSASFEPETNTNLIFQMIEERKERLEAIASGQERTELPALESVFFGDLGSSADRINTALRHREGRTRLDRFYSQQLLLVLAFFYILLSVLVVRRQLSVSEDAEGSLTTVGGVVDGFGVMVLYAAAALILLNVPGTYGVLSMPTEGATVEIRLSDQGDDHGREGEGLLLTDLSTQADRVWLLRRARGGRALLEAFDRSEIQEIVLLGEFTPNFLAVE